MVLILSRDDVRSLVTMKDAIDAVEAGFREYASGTVQMPVRTSFTIPAEGGWIGVMPAYIGGLKAFGTKIVSSYPKNPTTNRPAVAGIFIYNDPTTGEPLAVMEAGLMTALRTGAGSGVATKHLARKDAGIVGLLGAGAQARTQIEALTHVRSIREVKIFSPTPHHRDQFAREVGRSSGLEITPKSSAREAVEGVDILVVATSSKEPVFQGEWVGEGVHINAIGSHTPQSRELDDTIVKRAKIVVDSTAAALSEAGDLLIPINKGVITKSSIHAELGEIVTGRKRGRENDSEVTLFKSVGLALQDVALAKRIFDEASRRRVGVAVNLF